ncbi:MAG: ABC transporter ATP-binding protein [Bacillota bacterium]
MRTVSHYIKPYIGRMSIGLTIKFIGTMMDLVLPWLLAYLIDTVVPQKDVPSIYLYGAAMVLCSGIAVTFNVWANRMAAQVSMQITRKLRNDLFTRVSYLSFSGVDHFNVPSLISRLTNDTYNIHALYDKMQRLGVRAPLLVLGGITLSFTLEPTLALIQLLLSPLLAAIVFVVSRKSIPIYREAQQRVEGLVRVVRENAAGVRVIKALSKTEYEKKRFAAANMAVADTEKRAGRVVAVTNPAMGLLLNLGLTLVIIVGAFRVNAGLMQPGKIIAFLSYFTIIITATLSVTKIFTLWSRGSASAQRIEEVLLYPEDLPAGERSHEEDGCHIRFDHVSFSYNGKRNNLEDISFCLKRGQTLGIIGPTGSGKTTLVSLLMRFYDADSGDIRINGDNIIGIPREELAGMFGVVFQNDVLLNDSVYENISFLRHILQEEVERAARAAQASEFIEQLSERYAYTVDIRGGNLSGGQKQRILIARALAGKPEILILDDSESALDYRTTAALRSAIRREYADTTSVIISERVSSICNADYILVLDDGRVEGSGTHSHLMETCPSYRRIAQVQMGGAPA